MAIDFVSTRRDYREGFSALRKSAPDVMAGFADLHRASMAPGALDTATKELIALAIGVTSQCRGCLSFHVHDALRAGATREQIEEALGVAVMMGGGPAAMYAAEALEALHDFEMAGVERRGSGSG